MALGAGDFWSGTKFSSPGTGMCVRVRAWVPDSLDSQPMLPQCPSLLHTCFCAHAPLTLSRDVCKVVLHPGANPKSVICAFSGIAVLADAWASGDSSTEESEGPMPTASCCSSSASATAVGLKEHARVQSYNENLQQREQTLFGQNSRLSCCADIKPRTLKLNL